MSKSLNDVGEKIGNARKDLRGAMTLATLESMTPEEKASLVTKERVWPRPDWAALAEDGMEPTAAALLKIIRDRLSAKPTVIRGSDFEAAAKGYVTLLTAVMTAGREARTASDVGRIEAGLLAGIGYQGAPLSLEQRQVLFSAYANRKSPFTISVADRRKAAAMVAEGFPAEVPTWRRGVSFYKRGEGFVLVKGSKVLSRQIFADQEAALAWLKQSHADVIAAKQVANAPGSGDESAQPDQGLRPHLDRLERIGPDCRGGRNVDPEDFINDFGFRAVEFGKWLPQAERQQVVNMAYEALHDLARVLNLEPMDLSLKGTLALAFGSRGGGRFAAHYEPDRTVLNMTRLRGGGALAHEWGHAWDHFLGRQGGEPLEDREPRFASGGRTHKRSRLEALASLPEELAREADRLIANLRETPVRRDEALAAAETQLRHLGHRRVALDKEGAEQATRSGGQLSLGQVKERDRAEEQLAAATAAVCKRIQILKGGGECDLPTRRSAFFHNAIALSGASGYHARPTELLARAFESIVYDRLAETGCRSDYLVHGVGEGECPPHLKADPYPVGEERKAFGALFLRAMALSTPLLRPEAASPSYQP